MNRPPLHNATLLCPTTGEFDDPLYADVFEDIAGRAAALGATIVRDPRGDEDLHRAHLLGKPNAYTLIGSNALIREETADLCRRPEAFGITIPQTTPYVATRGQELSLPFMLAYAGLDNGEGKYLIGNAEQLSRVRAMLDKDREGLFGLAEGYEVREFITTPSEHYTSYRVVTSPEGIIAAGLLYSAHKKNEMQVIQGFNPNYQPITLDTNMWGRSPMTAFEDPRSPLFLQALDARSNVDCGGNCIPLMGENRRKTTVAEEVILEAHGIDPENPMLPERISEPAMSVARKVGRIASLVSGIDFLDDEQLTTAWFLEHNPLPGTSTWNACWNAGQSTDQAIREMHDAALNTLVAARS